MKYLITGGSGTIGNALLRKLLPDKNNKVAIFSRDELKQSEIYEKYRDYKNLRLFIGDVRDKKRLDIAMKDVDYVIHAAALKRIESCEYNPSECIKTNVIGTMNVLQASIDNNVAKVMCISTDKATNPVNTYGASKMLLEKLATNYNNYASHTNTKISCCRYGNVMGSRGSVIHLFREQAKNDVITITDTNMTRFWFDKEDAVEFILKCMDRANGREIFVPKLQSFYIKDLAEVIAPGCSIRVIGKRLGERLYETLITREDSRYISEEYNKYIICDQYAEKYEEFEYRSDTNHDFMSQDLIRDILNRPTSV